MVALTGKLEHTLTYEGTLILKELVLVIPQLWHQCISRYKLQKFGLMFSLCYIICKWVGGKCDNFSRAGN